VGTDVSKIALAEDRILERIRVALGDRVPTIDWAPPDWDVDFIKRLLLRLPGAILIFNGAERVDPGGNASIWKTTWTVVAVAAHPQGAKERARGDSKVIGCYQILEAVVGRLNGWTVPDVGTLEGTSWENDISLKLQNHALMVQSAIFEMTIDLSMEPDGSDLVPFLRFYPKYDIGQPDAAPETKDRVNLPQ
jgi:phage gp37-like protein